MSFSFLCKMQTKAWNPLCTPRKGSWGIFKSILQRKEKLLGGMAAVQETVKGKAFFVCFPHPHWPTQPLTYGQEFWVPARIQARACRVPRPEEYLYQIPFQALTVSRDHFVGQTNKQTFCLIRQFLFRNRCISYFQIKIVSQGSLCVAVHTFIS